MKEYKSLSQEIKLKVEKKEFNQVRIASSIDANDYARNFYFDDIDIYESVFIILLNTKQNTIGYAKISQGGVNMCGVDVKLICKYAIESLASGVILVHNHPSGNHKPSDLDNDLTKKTRDALEILGIKLLDHLIITSEDYYSYADNGKL